MNAKARTARQTLRQRRATTRAQARIRRHGATTLTTHCIAAGLPTRGARTVASSLRAAAKRLGITGRDIPCHRKGRTVTARVYTSAQVAQIAAAYRPRLAAYRTARTRLTLAA